MNNGTMLNTRYEIKRALGRGGQGQVYLAQDMQVGRLVAVKRLNPELGTAQALQRFKKEGDVMAQLDHPHIVPIYDKFVQEGILYYVMPYSTAGTLDDLFQQRRNQHPFHVAEVIEIGKSVASALMAVHAQRIVHRDVKLANVFISHTPKGFFPKLGDFGVAHIPTGPMLTGVGEVVGTLAYLAPEQVQGQPAQAASDLYALGVMLYRLLTGNYTHQFTDDEVRNREQILHADPAPLNELRPDVPPWLAELIMGMLAKQAGQRPTAAQVYARLYQAEGQGLGGEKGQGQGQIVTAERAVSWQERQYGLPVMLAASAGFSLLTALLVGWLFIAVWTGQGGGVVTAEAANPSLVAEVDDYLLPTVAPTAEAPSLTPTPGLPTAVVRGTTAFGGLNLRSEPTTDSSSLGKLDEGTAVEILDNSRTDGWVQVQTPRGSGWVFGEYLAP
jgi:eukaryotic-like serine/threonine-protein kinase